MGSLKWPVRTIYEGTKVCSIVPEEFHVLCYRRSRKYEDKMGKYRFRFFGEQQDLDNVKWISDTISC